ncbi:MAG: serine hydrolase domain-containing protein [Actinomycetota bacterium]
MSTIIPERVTKLLDRCRREVDEGRVPGCQVAVGFEGEVVLFEAFGDLTTDHRLHTYSAIKPTVSLTVLELAAAGLLDLDAPVASVLPTFASNGKEAITVSQVLLHASGFPHAPLGPAEFTDRHRRLERYGSWRTTWEPGTAFEYHASAAHWVLADLITEVTGRHHADVVTETVMTPAGCERWLAIPEDEQGDIADVVSVGEAPDLEEMARQFGIDEMPITEVTDDALLIFNRPDLRAAGHPGGGGIASAADIARWYQAILHDDGTILRPEVKADALDVVRQNHRDWMGVPANRTHAFTLSGDDGQSLMRGFGHGSGPGAFGHGGAKGQRAYADPSTGLSLGFMTHGLDRNDLVHAKRCAGVASAANLVTTPTD